jgi:hypothetical protein
MPCMKCANGKYKYGEGGRCQFDTLKACRAAAAAIHAKPKKDAAGSVMEAPGSVKPVDRDRNSTVCPKDKHDSSTRTTRQRS